MSGRATFIAGISAGGEADKGRFRCCTEVDGCCSDASSSDSSAEKVPSEESLEAILFFHTLQKPEPFLQSRKFLDMLLASQANTFSGSNFGNLSSKNLACRNQARSACTTTEIAFGTDSAIILRHQRDTDGRPNRCLALVPN